MVEHDVIAERDHEVADADGGSVAARGPCRSHPDRGEEDGEQSVEHDHQKDRFDDRGGGLKAKRLGTALHLEPLGAGHGADRQGHERRLDETDLEMRQRDRFPEAGSMKISGLMPP